MQNIVVVRRRNTRLNTKLWVSIVALVNKRLKNLLNCGIVVSTKTLGSGHLNDVFVDPNNLIQRIISYEFASV